MGDFCYQIIHKDKSNPHNGVTRGKLVRIHKKLGDMPIMVGSDRCHLCGKSPAELVRLKEEVSYVSLFVRITVFDASKKFEECRVALE